MEDVARQSTARSDFNTVLLAIFAALALTLAAIGIFGLMAYSVQQHTQEIGIRIAIGASPTRVLQMVFSYGMRLALIGTSVGIISAFGLGRVMVGLVYGVKPSDPFALSGAIVLLMAAAGLGAYIPAHRATRIDPVESIRYE
jgi:ABC-type antimicrobial peptide transport system permease subunit